MGARPPVDHDAGDGDEQQRHRSVQPVVVGRGDDRQEGDRRVGEDEQPPTGPADGDHAGGHEDGPPEVQRRHGRELVGHRPRRVGGIDPRPVDLERVDEALAGEHPRRSQRHEHVDDQRGQRDAEERGADAAVRGAVPGERPDQHGDRGREVDHHVVAVQHGDDQLAVQHDALDGPLREDVQPALDGHDAVGVVDGLPRVAAGEVADLAVGDEHGPHHEGLDAEREGGRASAADRRPGRLRAGRRRHRVDRGREPGGGEGGRHRCSSPGPGRRIRPLVADAAPLPVRTT